jgi:hypothetical protein
MGIDKNRTVSAHPQNIGDYFEMKANIFYPILILTISEFESSIC